MTFLYFTDEGTMFSYFHPFTEEQQESNESDNLDGNSTSSALVDLFEEFFVLSSSVSAVSSSLAPSSVVTANCENLLCRFTQALKSSVNGVLLCYSHHSFVKLLDLPVFSRFYERIQQHYDINNTTFSSHPLPILQEEKEVMMTFTIENGQPSFNHLDQNLENMQCFTPTSLSLTLNKPASSSSLLIPSKLIRLHFQLTSPAILKEQSRQPPKISFEEDFCHVRDYIASNVVNVEVISKQYPLLKTLQDILEVAQQKCYTHNDFLGFSLLFSSSVSFSSLPVMIWYFARTGFPLHFCGNSSSYIKKTVPVPSSVNSSSSLSSSNNLVSSECFSYYYIGGGNHPDTIAFNSTEDILHCSSCKSLSLAGGSLFAGKFCLVF
jgi:hypothetical protein